MEQHPLFLIPAEDSMLFSIGNLKEYYVAENELLYLPTGYTYAPRRNNAFVQIQVCVPVSESETYGRSPKVISLDRHECELIRVEIDNCNIIGISRLVRFVFQQHIKGREVCQQYDSLKYIDENLETDLSISKLAMIEHYSVPYYKEWFKARMGTSPSLYIREKRIEKAKELLISTSDTVINIAMNVGYSSNASFTKAFTSLLGCTPSDYRKENSRHLA